MHPTKTEVYCPPAQWLVYPVEYSQSLMYDRMYVLKYGRQVQYVQYGQYGQYGHYGQYGRYVQFACTLCTLCTVCSMYYV